MYEIEYQKFVDLEQTLEEDFDKSNCQCDLVLYY